MIKICALNESVSGDSQDEEPAQKSGTTKEAQETEAFSLYNKALTLQRQGHTPAARETFQQILELQFVKDGVAEWCEDEALLTPGRQLAYSTYKNLADLELQGQNITEAMTLFLQVDLVKMVWAWQILPKQATNQNKCEVNTTVYHSMLFVELKTILILFTSEIRLTSWGTWYKYMPCKLA